MHWPLRAQSFGEEIANSISHGLGAVASVVALPILIVNAAIHGGAGDVVGASIFGASLLVLYVTSTLLHALPQGRAKRVFEVLDHCAIFLLIAGTYTPLTLGVLSGAWGWSLFGVVWGIALFGVVMKSVFGATRFPLLSNVLYLLMGWIVLVALKPVLDLVPPTAMLYLVLGGVFYSVGVLFFVMENRWRFAHFVWHLFVLLGSVNHVIAVYMFQH